MGHFVVLRVDRFARSTEDHFAVRKLLLDCGVTLHELAGMQPGTMLYLPYEIGVPVELSVNGRALAVGEVVVSGERRALAISEVL